jgi:adenine/guanine phosphoribosyltransferase-like PRPP-binding protein
VLVVDDVFSRGITIGAILSHLCNLGLQAGATVMAFAPLWVPGN